MASSDDEIINAVVTLGCMAIGAIIVAAIIVVGLAATAWRVWHG